MNYKSFLIIKLILCIFLLNSLSVYSQHFTTVVENGDSVRQFQEGKVIFKEGTAFIYLKGSYNEAGLQYGTMMKKEITEVYELVGNFKKKMIKDIFDDLSLFPRIIAKASYPIVTSFKRIGFRQRTPSNYMNLIRGISSGSGVSVGEILDLMFMGDFNCSGFIIKQKQQVIHGRNFDAGGFDGLNEFLSIVHYNIDDQIGYINVLEIPGAPLIFQGVNKEGLTFSLNNANRTRNVEPSGSMFIINDILQNCSNLAEVENQLSGIKFSNKNVGKLFFIGSINDNAGEEIDFMENEFVVNRMKNNQICGTNFFLNDSMYSSNHTIFAAYQTSRIKKLRELLREQNNDNPIKKSIDILSNTDFYKFYEELPLSEDWLTINNNGTKMSVVFDAYNSSLYFAKNEHYAAWGKWLEYNYKNGEVKVYRSPNEMLSNNKYIRFWHLIKRAEDLKEDENSELRIIINEFEKENFANMSSYKMLSEWYYKLGDTKSAYNYLDSLINKFPELAYAYRQKARYLRDEKKYDEAIPLFHKSIEAELGSDFHDLFASYALALCYKRVGDVKNAYIYLNKANEIRKKYYTPKWLYEYAIEVESEVLSNH